MVGQPVTEEEFKELDKVHETWFEFLDEFPNYKSLVGYDDICKVEEFAKKHKDVMLIWCDDDVFATSLLMMIPHPTMGISCVFIPQCTDIQNVFFIYPKAIEQVENALRKIKKEHAIGRKV